MRMNQWPAMVLTAGYGTRLRPLSLVRAKPAMPVAGQALVRRILSWLRTAGLTDVVLNLHHRPETVEAAVGDGSDLGLRVRYSREDPILGTGGGPRGALPLLDADRFFIVNGDTLADASLSALEAEHRRAGALVTMAVVPNPDPLSYGGVLVDPGGSVTGFAPPGVSNRGHLFVGTQFVEASVFSGVPDDRPVDTVGHIYPRLIAERPGSVRALAISARFLDIGTPADYLATSLSVARLEGPPSRLRGARCHVAEDARLLRTVFWDDVTVAAGAALVECIVADGVHIPAGARFHRAAIIRGADAEPGGGTRVDQLAVSHFAVKPGHERALSDDAETG
jgi:mannose-1-phosphate guanylyltransferase